jgi:hypothetical protein
MNTQEVNNSEEVKYSIGDDAYGLKRIIKHIKTTDGLHEVIEIAAGVWDEHAKEIVDACNNYHSLETQLTDSLTAYNQVCERNDRLQEENYRLKEDLKQSVLLYQNQTNTIIAKQEEVDRLKEALTWYADSDNYLHNDDTLASAWSMNKNIELKAKKALNQTPETR